MLFDSNFKSLSSVADITNITFTFKFINQGTVVTNRHTIFDIYWPTQTEQSLIRTVVLMCWPMHIDFQLGVLEKLYTTSHKPDLCRQKVFIYNIQLSCGSSLPLLDPG